METHESTDCKRGPERPSTDGAVAHRSLLAVRELSVRYRLPNDLMLPALRGVTFELGRGDTLGVIGESGSGKTTLALALLGLVPTAEVEGVVEFGGTPLPLRDDRAMNRFRWSQIALVAQASGTGFDPVQRVGDQLIEPLQERRGLRRDAARERALRAWDEVGLPAQRFGHYPHQLSGGEKRRAMLAMALAGAPALLILDEPTSGLDSFTRVAILDLLRRLHAEHDLAMLVISHNPDDVRQLAQRALVLYAGRAVEVGEAHDVIESPRHPYTWGLVNAYPTMTRSKDLWGIRGEAPDPMCPPSGCAFAPRCTQTIDRCQAEIPALMPQLDRLVACHLGGLRLLLEARRLSKTFRDGPGPPVQAVQDASLHLGEGEVVAVVGQTGSGKTTLARMIVGLLEPDRGDVQLQGQPLHSLRGEARRAARRLLQFIFQDPYEALSPRLTALELVREPLDIQRIGNRAERDETARAALAAARLPTTREFLAKRVHELSGGQLQRIAIARALVVRPKVIVADEPTSMLDPSEQARVLRLLKDLQNDHGTALLLVSHDLPLVRKVADRVIVMEHGRIVEAGPSEQVVSEPRHPYTRRLLVAAAGARSQALRANGRAAPETVEAEAADDRLPAWKPPGSGREIQAGAAAEE